MIPENYFKNGLAAIKKKKKKGGGGGGAGGAGEDCGFQTVGFFGELF